MTPFMGEVARKVKLRLRSPIGLLYLAWGQLIHPVSQTKVYATFLSLATVGYLVNNFLIVGIKLPWWSPQLF